MKLWRFLLVAGAVIVSTGLAQAETRISLLHTSDIHGHYVYDKNPAKLGGIARVKYLADQLKTKNQNTLFFDSGDWSEGTIFYTLNSGEAISRVMDAMGYDAVTLGNHEWLIGPGELYAGLRASGMKTPILSANLNMAPLPVEIRLNDYIRPFITKWVGGKKIGIFGLSTFQLIYDSFLAPAKLRDPVSVTIATTRYLRNVEKCDMVILLSHLGYTQDKLLARIANVDAILGGHSHKLFTTPTVVSGVPIFNIGTWGQFLGEYQFVIQDDGKVRFERETVHQIHFSRPEDPEVKTLVEGFKSQIENSWGNVFHDQQLYSEVHLHGKDAEGDEPFGNWAADAIRDTGNAEVSFEYAKYFQHDLFPGSQSTVDVFEAFPHVYSSWNRKAWTVWTYDVKGWVLQALTNIFMKAGGGVKFSNAWVHANMDALLLPVSEFYIGGQKVQATRTYRVASSLDVVKAFEFLLKTKSGKIMGVSNLRDTGVEGWRAVLNKLRTLSPITPEKSWMEPRIRTDQPDIYIPYEQIVTTPEGNGQTRISFKVRNMGYTGTVLPPLRIMVDVTPQDRLDGAYAYLPFDPVSSTYIEGGQSLELVAHWNRGNLPVGDYMVSISANNAQGERLVGNNGAYRYFTAQ